MSASFDNYKILEKISDEANYVCYEAEDLRLGRIVVFNQLKINASEREGRDFLLHARMIGRLKHPGILPIYDMGLYDDAYFYCHRPPPGLPLRQELKDPKRLSMFRKSRRYRMQILHSLADTIAYAHSKGVALRHLDYDSIIIGMHGEVIISDWSEAIAMRHPKTGELHLDQDLIQEDLALLAMIGLKFCFLNMQKDTMTIVEWDKRVRHLPVELQLIFDQAFLQRPNAYTSVKEFQKDLMHHLEGRPLKQQKGDALAFLQGVYRRNRQPIHVFILILTLCVVGLTISLSQLNQLNHRELETSRSLSQLEKETSGLETKGNEIEKQLEKIKGEKDLLSGETQQISANIQILEENLRLAEEYKQNENHQLDELEKKKSNLETSLTQQEEVQEQQKERMEKSIVSEMEKLKSEIRRGQLHHDYYIEEYRQLSVKKEAELKEQYYEFLKGRYSPKSWFDKFLKGPRLSKLNMYRKLARYSSISKRHVSLDGSMLVLVENRNIHFFNMDEKLIIPNLKKMKSSISSIVFTNDPHVLHVLDKDRNILILRLSHDYSTVSEERWIETRKNFGQTLLPYSSPDLVRAYDRRYDIYEYTVPKEEEDKKFLPTVIEGDSDTEGIALSGNNILAMRTDEGVYFCNYPNVDNRETLIASENDKIEFGFLNQDSLFYMIDDQQISIYEVKHVDEPAINNLRPLEKVFMRDLVLQDSIKTIQEIPGQSKLWIYLHDGANVLWDYRSGEKENFKEVIQGEPLLASGAKVLTMSSQSMSRELKVFSQKQMDIDDYMKNENLLKKERVRRSHEIMDDLLVIREPEKEREEPFTNEGFDDTLETENEDNEEFLVDQKEYRLKTPDKVIDVYYNDYSDHILLINEKRGVEIWDLNEKKRIALLGRSSTDLKDVFFSNELDVVITEDINGHYEMW